MKPSDATNRLLLPPGTAQALADFLNNQQNTKSSAFKVFNLCRELIRLRSIETTAQHSVAMMQSGVLSELNQTIEQFRFSPYLLGLRPPGSRIETYEICWGGHRNAGETGSLNAANFVVTILRMTEAGSLGRVRQCICNRWFFAQSNKKTACSASCRFKKFKQTSEESFNKQRAAYMRDYRDNPATKKRRKSASRAKKQK
jgi:hypothetical protein